MTVIWFCDCKMGIESFGCDIMFARPLDRGPCPYSLSTNLKLHRSKLWLAREAPPRSLPVSSIRGYTDNILLVLVYPGLHPVPESYAVHAASENPPPPP